MTRAQYYMPGLGTGNGSSPPRWEIEYVTYDPSAYPTPPGMEPEEVKRLTPYGMEDLTIGSWVNLGRKLGKKKKLWKRFEEYMYLGG